MIRKDKIRESEQSQEQFRYQFWCLKIPYVVILRTMTVIITAVTGVIISVEEAKACGEQDGNDRYRDTALFIRNVTDKKQEQLQEAEITEFGKALKFPKENPEDALNDGAKDIKKNLPDYLENDVLGNVRESQNQVIKTVPVYVNGELSDKHLKRICSMEHKYEIIFRDAPDSTLMKMLIGKGCAFTVNPSEFIRLGITEIPYTENDEDYPLNEYGARIPKVTLTPSDMFTCTHGDGMQEFMDKGNIEMMSGNLSQKAPEKLSENTGIGHWDKNTGSTVCTLSPDTKTADAFREKLKLSARKIIKNLNEGKLPVLNSR